MGRPWKLTSSVFEVEAGAEGVESWWAGVGRDAVVVMVESLDVFDVVV
jgi:hypothetical protein